MNTVKERILETAMVLFHKQGYQQTGINQIIKESEIAKASLYYHFATKEALFIAFLQERHVLWLAKFEEFLNGKTDRVLASFDFITIDNNLNDFRGCSFLNTLSEIPSTNTSIYDEIRKNKSSLLDFFKMEIKDDDLAYVVYSLYENAILECQIHRSNEPVLKLKEIVKNLITKNAII